MIAKTSLIGSLFAVLCLTACAAETSGPESTGSIGSDNDDAVEIGQVQQGLCPRGMICTPPRTGTAFGGASGGFSGEVAPPDPGPTFSCATKANGCDPVLRQDASGAWYCKNPCTGGGFGLARYNPCPSWAPRYTCTPYGVCQCY